MRTFGVDLLAILLYIKTKTTVADNLKEDQCVTSKIQFGKKNVSSTFYICPKINYTGHLCDFANRPFEQWFHNLTVYKGCCEDSNKITSWRNKTQLNDCNAEWQDPFLDEHRYCNYSSKNNWSKVHRKGLINPTSLHGIIWVIAALAICGNAAVLTTSLHLVMRTYKAMTKVQRVHHVLLINLAIADFLTGVYLLSVAIIGIVYSGPKGRLQVVLTMSSFCSCLGIINVVSNQMSVTVLVLITSFRLYSVVRPYKAVSVKLAIVLAAASWLFWLVFANIPTVGTEKIKIAFDKFAVGGCSKGRAPRVVTYEIIRNVVESFLQKINSSCSVAPKYSNLWLSGSAHGRDILAIAKHVKLINEKPMILKYYVQQNLCSPRYFSSGRDGAKLFGLSMLAFNFAAFVYLLVVYVFIYIRASYCGRSSSSNHANDISDVREVENARLQRKLFLIIVTDFLCWVPASLVAFWHLMYTKNPQDRETCHAMLEWKHPLSIFAIIVVSINSALNPLLYSSAPTVLFKFVCRCRRRQTCGNITPSGAVRTASSQSPMEHVPH